MHQSCLEQKEGISRSKLETAAKRIESRLFPIEHGLADGQDPEGEGVFWIRYELLRSDCGAFLIGRGRLIATPGCPIIPIAQSPPRERVVLGVTNGLLVSADRLFIAL